MNEENIPLADRIRPENLEDFFGQEKLIGDKSFLSNAIGNDSVPSMILWGPPGSGKTTLSHIIAKNTGSEFITLSATSSGKKDLVEVVAKARNNQLKNKKTILFIDEIHRWNKSQQDALLPSVEKGVITLIGATTENPSFEVNSALLSRTRVFVLEKLSQESLEKIISRAVKIIKTKIGKESIAFLARMANGDARTALNVLDILFSQKNKEISVEKIKEVFQKTHLLYDKNGEEHYNIISALHKSMRGGDANAAVYWMARMLEGGEDPIYIARRLVRFASEDVGLANNTALILANAVFDACHKLGAPECNVHLAQCVIYLSKSKKDITAYEAYTKAKSDVEKFGNLPVPFHIRNTPTKLMKDLGYAKNYKYTPKEDSSTQEYFPKELEGRKYF
ncbi:MAG: recombination factor protein RarA [Candidatus Moranbacteria bacterium GW2011_GWF2_36_839]|nr:MAG: recombination factor protein RarA [Candidatus Moranbacteria bacterium GW2011_GWF1_36_78]KKQ17292.1 MAG: recombination factor protein RarA [Candidatus Moranbacteria bacterium GW2011_GWF2_36_839]HAT73864.1 AAA family ATPase [Candidatus Moranbacteria bacterium]HBY10993.1 AAA family ATPase [Candidatus Moranbacteria bacterium]